MAAKVEEEKSGGVNRGGWRLSRQGSLPGVAVLRPHEIIFRIAAALF
jgi:hypothetical protein